MTPRYPQVVVELVGMDGNAYSILGRCTLAAKRAGLSKNEIDEFVAKATSGNYDGLLRTVVEFFEISDPEEEEEEDDYDDDDD